MIEIVTTYCFDSTNNCGISSFTKADPSAVDIEPGKIKLYANLSMKFMQNKKQFFKFYFYFFMFLFYLTNI